MRGGWSYALPALCLSVAGWVRSARRLGAARPRDLDAFAEGGAPPTTRGGPSTGRRRGRRQWKPDVVASGAAVAAAATGDFWEDAASTCFHLDAVCGSGEDGWFYAAPPAGGGRQPAIRLLVDPWDVTDTHGYQVRADPRLRFNVSSAGGGGGRAERCQLHPVPVHLVAQAAYGEMMGEFYSRVVLPLNRWLRDLPHSRRRPADDVQTYVHFVDRRKQRLLEGHRLFLGGLPNNNEFHSFLDLMPRNESCRCYKKLVFCGYKVGNATARKLNVTHHDGARVAPERNFTVFTPRAAIQNPRTECAALTDPRSFQQGRCAAYRRLRRELRDTYAAKDPRLEDKVRDHRRRLLEDKGFLRRGAGDPEEWTFVGLAHRKYRRRWLNIEDAVAACDDEFRHRKIACVTVDVEAATGPEEQLLMHRALHALVGVHGAQLTQGVLLPRGAHVLELLPWVPFYLWGGWVTSVHRPTPLGVIFHNTDLSHVGYPLGRDSVPLCSHVNASDRELDRACLMDNSTGVLQKFRWADRDFNVPIKAIKDFIAVFLLKDHSSICEDMQQQAAQHDFVLYNALCRRKTNQTEYVVEHYYREKDDKEPRNIHEHKLPDENKTR